LPDDGAALDALAEHFARRTVLSSANQRRNFQR
jgi:hypothetical protein